MKKIKQFILVYIDKILIEIHINYINENKNKSLSMKINNDGESILFNENNFWQSNEKLNFDKSYLILRVSKINQNSDFGKFIEKNISYISYGLGIEKVSNNYLLYYIKIHINEDVILFFNNGDNGFYKINEIDKILQHDIFNVIWKDFDLSKPIINL